MLNITNKCYANVENVQKEYIITQNEESKFLEDIYNTETDTLKIKSIDKKISDQNYIDKQIIETRILDKQNEQYIRNQFGETRNFYDNEYIGTLSISNINIENIKNGYYEKIDEKVLSFSDYLDNDLNNIEKEMEINNIRYYLINVEWEPEDTQVIDNENVPITYRGKKIYQTVQKIANPDTYKVTVTYSGGVEKVNTIYDYTVNYEKEIIEKKEEVIEKEENENKVTPIIIVSGIGITAILMFLFNRKNTYIYAKSNNGFKLIKMARLSNKNISIDISKCKKLSNSGIYAIKVRQAHFSKIKGQTITIINGKKKSEIVLWNNYYEIRL